LDVSDARAPERSRWPTYRRITGEQPETAGLSRLQPVTTKVPLTGVSAGPFQHVVAGEEFDLRSFRDGTTVPRLQARDQRKHHSPNNFRAYPHRPPTPTEYSGTHPGKLRFTRRATTWIRMPPTLPLLLKLDAHPLAAPFVSPRLDSHRDGVVATFLKCGHDVPAVNHGGHRRELD
jgi:hypothetical protein